MTEPSEPTGARAEQDPGQIVIRDKRKLTASGGAGSAPPAGAADAAAEPAPSAAPGTGAGSASGLGAELAALRTELDERTRDLQRERADYANYRKRVQREKAMAADEATAAVFRAVLPVLDDLDRARDHGDLSQGVATVVDQLVATAGKFGLSPFGEKGDPFDPTRHEAVAHQTSPEVTQPTCVEVLRRGYLLGDRLLRPAMVAVADPAEPEGPGRSGTASTSAAPTGPAAPGGDPGDAPEADPPARPGPAEGS